GLSPVLAWANPPDTAQYQIQVLPVNLDGPAINLMIGAPDLVRSGRFTVQAPEMGKGNYILLPGMTYTWRVRTSPVLAPLTEERPGWTAYAGAAFRTPAPTSATIRPIAPLSGGVALSAQPTLQWTNANNGIFYYEVQLSPDPAFNTDPATATAAVFWNLVH